MPKTVSDVLGLVTFAAVVVAIFMARRRIKATQARAVASVRMEGFEAGKAAVLASIGTTVVVNQQQGAGGPAQHDRSALDLAALVGGDLGLRANGDPRLLRGVPVGLHSGADSGDVRAARSEALADDDRALRILLHERSVTGETDPPAVTDRYRAEGRVPSPSHGPAWEVDDDERARYGLWSADQ